MPRTRRASPQPARRSRSARAARRRARAARRQGFRSLLVSTLLASAVFFIAGLAWRVLEAPVDAVRIVGDLSRIEHEEVRTAVVAALQSTMTGVSDIAAAIEELDWARDAHVRRVWPHTLQVWVERAALTARWGEDHYLTTSGEVVEAPKPPGAPLPHLTGTLSSGAETMRIYEMLSDQLTAHGLRLATLEQTVLGGWRLTLGNGAIVLLGSEDLVGRMGRVLAVYEDAPSDRADRVERFDARYGSGVAVRWRSDGGPGLGGTEAVATLAGK